jgi:PPE-SVP subfamily C-terminal region
VPYRVSIIRYRYLVASGGLKYFSSTNSTALQRISPKAVLAMLKLTASKGFTPLRASVSDAITESESRLSTLLTLIPNALQSLATATSPGTALQTLSGLATIFGGPNFFGYPVGIVPAVASIMTINFGNAVRAKVVSAPAPAPALAAKSPTAAPAATLASAAARGNATIAAQMGRAPTMGALSVPQDWPAAIIPAARAIPNMTNSPLLLTDSSGTLFSQAGMAALTGRALGAAAAGMTPPVRRGGAVIDQSSLTARQALEALHEAKR